MVMKLKTIIGTYWQGLLTVVFAVAVFCFWQFWLPHLLLAREQMQLFLWNTDYLTERFAVPGGFSQYLGEFIVQFFLNPVYGALWYVALFVAAQLLTWRLLIRWTQRDGSFVLYLLSFIPSILLWYLACNPNIPMTPIVAVVLTLGLLNLLPKARKACIVVFCVMIPVVYWLAGGDFYWESDKVGTYDEMEYDMLMRRQQWATMTDRYEKKPTESLAIRNAVLIALWNQQRISQQEMMNGLTLTNQTLKSVSSAFLMSEVSLPIGMVNMSQRSAFEAMEAIPNYNKSARALRRLVETNIITGQYDVARKYIYILEETTFYRSWAQRMNLLIEHPEQIKDYPLYHRLKELYDNGNDEFFY
jgi:hypothetical protein